MPRRLWRSSGRPGTSWRTTGRAGGTAGRARAVSGSGRAGRTSATPCRWGGPPTWGRLCQWGLVDVYRVKHPEPGRYSWWDYRAGDFHKNFGMRIDQLLATRPVAARTVAAEIDREARKGKPTPSDHAPVVMDLDKAGHPFDAGLASAESPSSARRSR